MEIGNILYVLRHVKLSIFTKKNLYNYVMETKKNNYETKTVERRAETG